MKKVAVLMAATLLWLPCLHFVYARAPDPAPLLKRQLALIECGQAPRQSLGAAASPSGGLPHARLADCPQLAERERAAARAANPEWDLMGRSFVAWALANWALRDPLHTGEALRGIDATLDGVLAIERDQGFRAFLLPYGRGRFQEAPDRSLFVDSEIALTAALRRLVRDDRDDLKRLSRQRAELIADRIRRAPLGLVESYPDEGWTFDHAVAL